MDITTRLGLKRPGARGTHPSTNELRDALRDNAALLDSLIVTQEDAAQEGVVGDASVGLPFQIAPTTVRVSAGIAWVDGDGVGGLNGRYRVTWPQTDVTIPLATGANFRGHRITVPVPTSGHGASAPVLRAGVDNATVTIDSLNANTASLGAPALPAGEMQVAAVVASSSAITAVRDRRPRALGFTHNQIKTTTTGAQTSSTTAVTLAAGELDFRVECNGVNLLKIALESNITLPSSSQYWVQLLDNGVAIKEWWADNFSFNTFAASLVPTAGTHLYQWQHKISGAANTGGLNIYAHSPAVCSAIERLGGVGNNGTT